MARRRSHHTDWLTETDPEKKIILKRRYARQIGNRIKKRITELKFKKGEAAKKCGCKQTTLTNYFTGDNIPTPRQALLLCEGLGLSLDYLYRGIDPSAGDPE